MKRALLTVLALGAFVVENAFDFVGSVPYFRRLTGGLGILDMLPLPDPERAHRALELLGDAGRRQYAILLVTFDIAFPLTLALFFRAWLGRAPALAAVGDARARLRRERRLRRAGRDVPPRERRGRVARRNPHRAQVCRLRWRVWSRWRSPRGRRSVDESARRWSDLSRIPSPRDTFLADFAPSTESTSLWRREG